MFKKTVNGIEITVLDRPIGTGSDWIYRILCIICGKEKKARWSNLQRGWSLKCRPCSAKAVGETLSNRCKSELAKVESAQNAIVNIVLHRAHIGTMNATTRKRAALELTREDVKDIIFKNCAYCGIEPNQTHLYYNLKFHGIDRVDSSIGYTKENCVPCCKACNRAKSDRSYEDFIQWVERIYLFNKEKFSKVA